MGFARHTHPKEKAYGNSGRYIYVDGGIIAKVSTLQSAHSCLVSYGVSRDRTRPYRWAIIACVALFRDWVAGVTDEAGVAGTAVISGNPKQSHPETRRSFRHCLRDGLRCRRFTVVHFGTTH